MTMKELAKKIETKRNAADKLESKMNGFGINCTVWAAGPIIHIEDMNESDIETASTFLKSAGFGNLRVKEYHGAHKITARA